MNRPPGPPDAARRRTGAQPRPAWPSRHPLAARALCVLALALAARLAWQQTTSHSPLYQTFQMDAEWHADWARQIAAGNWSPDRPFFRAPLYPFFLAAAYGATGGSFDGARVVQHLLGALSCVLLFDAGRRIYGAGAGLAAGLIAALYGPLIHYENELLTPCLEVFFLSAAIAALSRAWERPSGGRMLAAGVLLGLGCITRPTLLVVAAAACAWWAWAMRGRSAAAGRARQCALLLAGTALPIAPVTWHNVHHGGEWVLLATQGGVNFFIGNHSGSDGRTAVAPGVDFAADEAFVDNVWTSSRSEAERLAGRRLSDGEVSDYWYGRGLSFWRESPLRATGLALRKAYYLVNGYEIASLRSPYLDGRDSKVAAALLWTAGLSFPAGLVLPLALAGLGMRPSGAPGLHGLVRVVAVAGGVTVVAFFVNSRLRMPLMPPAILLCGHALASIGRAAAAGGWRAAARPAAAAALVVLGCNTRLLGVGDEPPADRAMFLGHAHRLAGRMEEAAEFFREALAAEPDRPEALHNLGVALLRLGRAEEALAGLRRAAAARPDSPAIHNSLGSALEEVGRVEEATGEYRRAMECDAGYYLARVNLARLALRQRRPAEAIFHLEEAVRLKPGLPQALRLLGVALLETGRIEESTRAFESSLAGEPDRVEGRLRIGATLQETGHLEEALSAYRSAAGESPACAEALSLQGPILAEQGRLDEAADVLERALQLKGDDGQARYNLALIELRRGRHAAALGHLRAAQAAGVVADPGLEEAIRAGLRP
jgi:Flp pilus assembly protein TadD/4-amino-4-deoxy-L-arabinose transferase-like glycosyltransferase